MSKDFIKTGYKLVSICVIVFNQEGYIEDCIKSILDIDYPRLEIIISDDCSADKSIDIVKKYEGLLEKKAERYKLLINSKNIGICRNINQAWKESKGEYIKLIAADDILFSNAISDYVKYGEKNPQYDIIHSNMIIIDENTKYPILDLSGFDTFHKDDDPVIGSNTTKKLLEGANVASPTFLYRNSTSLKYGYYDEGLYFEDTPYLLKVSVMGEIGYLDSIIGAYRIHQGSASHLSFSEKDRKKHDFYIKSRMLIYQQYLSYMDSCNRASVFGDLLCQAVLYKEKENIANIKDFCKRNNISIPIKYKIKTFLIKANLYKLYKEIID